LRKFKSERMENGVAGPTCNRSLAYLRRMFKRAQRQGKVANIPYLPMERESEPREGFLERREFERLRAAMPEHLHPALTTCYETGYRTDAMQKIIWWPLLKLAKREVSLPPGIAKNRKPLTFSLSVELVAMLKKKFQTNGPVFDMKNFRREWFKTRVKIGVGEKTGPGSYQYKGLTPHDFRRSAVRTLINASVEQATAMKITGHCAVSVFQSYNIVSTEQLHAALAKVSNNARTTQNGVRSSRK
jgi:integrase